MPPTPMPRAEADAERDRLQALVNGADTESRPAAYRALADFNRARLDERRAFNAAYEQQRRTTGHLQQRRAA